MTEALILFTTFRLLKRAKVCERSYLLLDKHLGGDLDYGIDTPINIKVILENNGLNDAIWTLRATQHNMLADEIARSFAADCAAAVLDNFERECPSDPRPRKAIAAARAYVKGFLYWGELAHINSSTHLAAHSTINQAAHSAALAAAYSTYTPARMMVYSSDYSPARSADYSAAANFAANFAVDSAARAAADLTARAANQIAKSDSYWPGSSAYSSSAESASWSAKSRAIKNQIKILKGYLG